MLVTFIAKFSLGIRKIPERGVDVNVLGHLLVVFPKIRRSFWLSFTIPRCTFLQRKKDGGGDPVVYILFKERELAPKEINRAAQLVL